MRRIFPLFFIFLLSLSTSVANEDLSKISFLQMRLDNNDSPISILAIDQDEVSGSLWMATRNGLVEFNGYKYTSYFHHENDTNSLLDNWVRDVMVDEENRVWAVTSRGLSLLNRRDGYFENFYYKKSGVNVEINCIEQYDEKLLILATQTGVVFFDIEQSIFTKEEYLSGVRSNNIFISGDNIFVGTDSGLYTYSKEGRQIRAITLDSSVGDKSLQVKAIQQRGSDNLWVATFGNGLYRYNLKSGEVKNYLKTEGIISNYIHSLSLDEDDNLWVGTLNGLNIYDDKGDSFYSYASDPTNENSLSQNSIRSIFADNQGGMWLGTFIGGLNYYHPLQRQFKHINRTTYEGNAIKVNVVSYIIEDNRANLWIGTNDGGLNYYNTTTRSFDHLPLRNALSESGAIYNNIKTLYTPDDSKYLYVGMHTGGFAILDIESRQTQYFNTTNSNIGSDFVYAIIPADSENLYLGTFSGLVKFNIKNRSFTPITHDKRGQRLNIKDIYVMFADSQERIWIGSASGVERIIEEDGDLFFDTSWDKTLHVAGQVLNCITEVGDGVFLFGTRTGLYKYDERSGVEESFEIDLVPSSSINGILEDAYGRIWLSSYDGLCCYNPAQGSFKMYSEASGVHSGSFTNNAFCKTESGEFYFGGINGITHFFPETIEENPYSPSAIITGLNLFNTPVTPNDESGILSEPISMVDEITLKPNQNFFSILFNVCNFVSLSHNSFSYKLDGFDLDWIDASQSNVAAYTNVPAGEYTFMLKCANNDEIWCREITQLRIKILPQWYNTWYAILSFLLVAFSLIYFFMRLHLSRRRAKMDFQMERKDKENQAELNQLKIQFYINMSHELRTPLTLILAPLQELLQKVREKWLLEQLNYIGKNANRLLHIVNQLMDYRRAELGIFKLQVGRGNLHDRALHNFLYYDKFAQKKEIDFNFYSDIQDEAVLFDEEYFELIINNLLSNAFKFTESGDRIYIKLTRDAEGESVVLEVTDTGCGIPEDKQDKIFTRFYQLSHDHLGSGVGISLVKRLVDLHHGQIRLQSKEGEGASFFITFPQREALYSAEEFAPSTSDDDSVEECHYATNSREMHLKNIEDYDGGSELSLDVEGDDSRSTILIVDDNTQMRRFIATSLSNLYNVIEVANGVEALEVLKTQSVDLVLTDLMMPVMDGLELCRQIKLNIKTYHIPIYIISAKSEQSDHLKGLKAGADDYISKPFSMDRLSSKIQNTLRTRHRAFENYSNSININPKKIASNVQEEEWLSQALKVVNDNLDNIEFSTDQLAMEMNMSRSNLYLKLKAITGQSAIDFIHKVRFGKACELLKEGKYSVSEISYMVGYNTPSYFSSRFKKYMNCSPSDYLKDVE